jgi:lambda family phage portal protein
MQRAARASKPANHPSRGPAMLRAAMAVGALFDRALAPFAPTWAARRLTARIRFAALSTYEAASRDRTVGDWRAKNASADAINLLDEPSLRARARMAKRDDWLGAAIADAARRDVVGTGIMPKANALDPGGEKLEKFNTRADDRFRRWARNPKLVDAEGRKNLRQICALAQDEKVTTGNAFVVLGVTVRRSDPSLTLQMFETDQLADDYEARPEGDNEVRGGIEVDVTGRPVAYHVHLNRHPDDIMTRGVSGRPISTKPVRIPAHRVLHLARQSRVRETLSVTRLAPVLRQMWNRQGYDSNELLAKKKEAFLAFGIKTDPVHGDGIMPFNPTTGANEEPGSETRNAGGYREIAFEPGQVPVTFPGESIEMYNPTRPGPNYEAYMRRQTTMIAAGVGRSPSAITRDYAIGSYGAIRQGLLDDWAEIDQEQLDMIDLVLRPIYERFILLEVLEGKLDAPGFFDDFETRDRYVDAEWVVPPRRWIDPAKEAAAAKIAIDYRLKSRRDLINADWRDVLDQIALERQYARDGGTTLPEDQPGGPTVSPSEPKVHGTGDEQPAAGEAPVTQRSKRNGRHTPTSTDQLADAILVRAVAD